MVPLQNPPIPSGGRHSPQGVSSYRFVASPPAISKHDLQPRRSRCDFTLQRYSPIQGITPPLPGPMHTHSANHRQAPWSSLRRSWVQIQWDLASPGGGPSSTLRLQLIIQLRLVRIHRRHKGNKAVLLRVHFLKCAPQHWGPAGSRGDTGPNSQRNAAHPVPGRVTAHTSIIKGSKRYLKKNEFNLTQVSLGNLLVPGHFTP